MKRLKTFTCALALLAAASIQGAKASTISITWTGDDITEVQAAGPFYVDYFKDDTLFVTLGFGPGTYDATVIPGDFTTEILTDAMQPIASAGELIAFDPAVAATPELSTMAVPELSTWLMMLMGFTGLGFAASARRRAAA